MNPFQNILVCLHLAQDDTATLSQVSRPAHKTASTSMQFLQAMEPVDALTAGLFGRKADEMILNTRPPSWRSESGGRADRCWLPSTAIDHSNG